MISWRHYFYLGPFVWALFLSGCTTTSNQQWDSLAQRLTIQPSHEMVAVPFYRQNENQCGATSLAMLLGYHGIEVTLDELEKLLYIPDKKGSLAIEIVAQARQANALVYPLSPSIEDVLLEINSGNPVLVLQNLGLSWYPKWHFAVVVGYDLNNHELILRSGETKRQRVKIRHFVRSWSGANKWAIVLSPNGKVPVTARPLDYLNSAAELEQVGKLHAAKIAYSAALKRWPSHADSAHFGLANIAYAQHDLPHAKNQLVKAIEANPHNANAWNNLAYVLSDIGCHNQAIHAIECASLLDPTNPLISQSKAELISVDEQSDAKFSDQALPIDFSCQLPACVTLQTP